MEQAGITELPEALRATIAPVDRVNTPCTHRGAETGETVQCGTCRGGVKLKLFSCALHGRCTPMKKTGDIACCVECPDYAAPETNPRRIILRNRQSPGDVLVMSAAVHSLHVAHPGEFKVAVESPCSAIWENNLGVVPVADLGENPERVDAHYPLIHRSDSVAAHFMQGYCDYLAQALSVPVPLATNRPFLYLSDQEKKWISQVEEIMGRKRPFWVVNAGIKSDYTAKIWGTANFQRVVDLLRGRVLFVQVGSLEHLHKPLTGVVNLLGKTDLRQLIRLVYHARGTLSGVTLLHHLAAALEKPSVTIMGGREPVQWNAYPKCHLFHTIGMLDCCRQKACWRSRVERRDDNDEKNESLCEQPVPGVETIPRCMAMISPEEVARRIELIDANL